MTELFWFSCAIFIILIIDQISVATRAAFLHPNILRLLNQHDHSRPSSIITVRLVGILPKVKASLNLALIIDRIIFGGLLLYFLRNLTEVTSVWILIGSLFLAAWVVFTLSWIVESLVYKNSEVWAIRLTHYAQGLTWLMTPLVFVTISLFPSQPPRQGGIGSNLADEIKSLVDSIEQEGSLEQAEGKMISSIFDMGNTLAKAIMVPRIDMLAIDVETPIPTVVDILLESGHSRLPVYQETIDNILGLLYAKDLLRVWREGKNDAPLKGLLRPTYFVPEAKHINELLAEMQAQRIHMVMVVDEYGGIAGLVTLEDIMEEILGEIQDEYDQGEELPYQEISRDEYIFQGKIDLDELNDILESHLPTEDADTLGGYIYSQVGRVPVGGEEIRQENLILTVEKVVGRRIKLVRVRRVPDGNYEENLTSDVNG